LPLAQDAAQAESWVAGKAEAESRRDDMKRQGRIEHESVAFGNNVRVGKARAPEALQRWVGAQAE